MNDKGTKGGERGGDRPAKRPSGQGSSVNGVFVGFREVKAAG